MKRLYCYLLFVVFIFSSANTLAEEFYFNRIWAVSPDELRNIPATVASNRRT